MPSKEQIYLLKTSSRSLGELMTAYQWTGNLLVASGKATMPPCKNVYEQLDAFEEIAVKAHEADPDLASKLPGYWNEQLEKFTGEKYVPDDTFPRLAKDSRYELIQLAKKISNGIKPSSYEDGSFVVGDRYWIKKDGWVSNWNPEEKRPTESSSDMDVASLDNELVATLAKHGSESDHWQTTLQLFLGKGQFVITNIEKGLTHFDCEVTNEEKAKRLANNIGIR